MQVCLFVFAIMNIFANPLGATQSLIARDYILPMGDQQPNNDHNYYICRRGHTICYIYSSASNDKAI